MREHLGVDVDAMYNEDLMANQPVKETHDVQKWDPDKEERFETGETSKVKTSTVIGRAEVSVRDPLTQSKCSFFRCLFKISIKCAS